MAAGETYDGNYKQTIWVWRLTRAGQDAWLGSDSLPGKLKTVATPASEAQWL